LDLLVSGSKDCSCILYNLQVRRGRVREGREEGEGAEGEAREEGGGGRGRGRGVGEEMGLGK
jgi:hypothetical protein